MAARWRTQTTNLQAVTVEACWRPMEGDVAGDFYDVIDLRDGRVAVIVGDALEGEKRRRTIEILKMRGCSHRKGEHLFTLLADGIVIVPVAITSLTSRSSTTRLSCGVPGLDEMFDGGLFEKSLWLVAGPTGTGKSLLAAQFVTSSG